MEQLTLEQIFNIRYDDTDCRRRSSDIRKAFRAVQKQYLNHRFYYQFDEEGKNEMMDFYQMIRHLPYSVFTSKFIHIPSVYENSRQLYEKTLHMSKKHLTQEQRNQIAAITDALINQEKDYAYMNLYGSISREYEYNPQMNREEMQMLKNDVQEDLIRLMKDHHFAFGIIHYEQANEETAFAMFVKTEDGFAKLPYSLLRQSGLLMKLSLDRYQYQKDISQLPFTDLTRHEQQTLTQYFKEKIREGIHPKTAVLYALDAVEKKVEDNHAYYLHTRKGMEEMIDLYQYYNDTIACDLIYRLSINDIYRGKLPDVVQLAKDTLKRYGLQMIQNLNADQQKQIDQIMHAFMNEEITEASICFHGTFDFTLYYNSRKDSKEEMKETADLFKAYLSEILVRGIEGIGAVVVGKETDEAVCYLAVDDDCFVELNHRSIQKARMSRRLVNHRIKNEIHIPSLRNVVF